MLETGRINLTAEDYYVDREAVRKGWLDKIDQSPDHLQKYFQGLSRPETPTLKLGRLTHVAVLEPDLLTAQFVRPPTEINRRTKVGKAEYAEWQKANESKTIVTSNQWDQAIAIRDAVYRNKAVQALLKVGEPEQTVVWVNPETGEKCKARADWLRNFPVDVKTTIDARPDAFARSIVTYRYDVQVYHYGDGFVTDQFVFIAVESAPPYASAVYLADQGIWKRGKAGRDRNLRTYAECKATDTWPSYPEIIQTIQLPRWAAIQS